MIGRCFPYKRRERAWQKHRLHTRRTRRTPDVGFAPTWRTRFGKFGRIPTTHEDDRVRNGIPGGDPRSVYGRTWPRRAGSRHRPVQGRQVVSWGGPVLRAGSDRHAGEESGVGSAAVHDFLLRCRGFCGHPFRRCGDASEEGGVRRRSESCSFGDRHVGAVVAKAFADSREVDGAGRHGSGSRRATPSEFAGGWLGRGGLESGVPA